MVVEVCIKKLGARKESPGVATGRGGSSRSPQVAAAVAVIAARIAAVAAALRAALSGRTGRRV